MSKSTRLFLISEFRGVLNVVYILLGGLFRKSAVCNQELSTSMGRKLQDTFHYFKTSGSRKPNYSPPVLSSYAADITTPLIASYSSINSSIPQQLTESIDAPGLTPRHFYSETLAINVLKPPGNVMHQQL
jgi:hypothetical protein